MKTKNNGLVITALILTGLPSAWAQKTAKPMKALVNIVLFVADDLGATDIGPYGNRVVRTPNINLMAKESLLFSCAFASSPTCSPSRASIHTGLMPFHNGAHANHAGIKDGVRTLPVYLNALGYRVAIAGKLHVGPMSAYPFELIHNSNVPEPGYEDKGVLWTDLNMTPVDDWLSKVSTGNKPFMLIVNDHSPHVIWPEKSDYKASEVDIPSFHIDTEDTRKSRARYYTDISKMDRNVGKLLKSLEEHQLAENTVVIFTSDQGPQWAFGKWNLYDYGIRVPLLIRWPGKILGGTETDAMVSLVDLLPTVVELAGGVAPKEPEAIDGRSLLPLISGEKNTHREVVFACHTGDGTMNQSPLRMIRTRQYKYILNLAHEILYTTHIDKAKDHNGGRQYWPSWVAQSYENEHAASVMWRYHNRPNEELYDVKKDPDETRNLANDPLNEEIMKNFRSQMTQWRQQQGDQESGTFLFPKTGNKEPVAPYIFK